MLDILDINTYANIIAIINVFLIFKIFDQMTEEELHLQNLKFTAKDKDGKEIELVE